MSGILPNTVTIKEDVAAVVFESPSGDLAELLLAAAQHVAPWRGAIMNIGLRQLPRATQLIFFLSDVAKDPNTRIIVPMPPTEQVQKE